MTRNNNKRAMLLSFVSVVLCMAMLVGTTYAWFTDTATVCVNEIQAGIIDLRLTDLEGNNMEGETLNWVDKNGNTDVLWEPGVTFYTEPVRLWNYSNLSFVLDYAVTGFAGDLELLEAIEYKLVQVDDMKDGEGNYLPYDKIDEAPLSNGALQATWFGIQADWENWQEDWNEDGVVDENDLGLGPKVGEPKPLTDVCVIAHMKEDADNKYQGMSLKATSITFMAKQYTFEYDSYTNQYDATADWPIIVANKGQLDEVLADDKVNKVTVVGGQYTDTVTVPSGKTLTSASGLFTPTEENVALNVEDGAEIILDGGTYATVKTYIQVINAQAEAAAVTVNEGTYSGGVAVWNNGTAQVTINGGTFNTWALAVTDNTNVPVIVNGGTFNLGSGGIDAGTGANVIINGGTFTKDPTNWVAEGKTVVEDNGIWIVK